MVMNPRQMKIKIMPQHIYILLYWVVPENIHTHTTGGISEFRRGGRFTSTGIPRTWGVHWTGIPKAWGDFQESNFQFGVVKSLQEKLIKNDLSKDDDSLVNTRHVQLNQHAGSHFSMVMVNKMFMLT